MQAYHFVARVNRPATPFNDDTFALAAWKGLHKVFPLTMAVVLMPNHFHVVAYVEKLQATQVRLKNLLASLSRWHRLTRGFEVTPEPDLIPDQEKLKRDMRYVFLNPCRARLCPDPLEWRWSSYRQLLGMAHGMWTQRNAAITSSLGWSGRKGLERLHAYVSSDPSVKVEGTPLPKAAPAFNRTVHCSLDVLFSSARAAHPEELDSNSPVIRASFVRLAVSQGWSSRSQLARHLQTSRSSIQYWLEKPFDSTLLEPERYCLADRRLRQWTDRSGQTA